MGGDSAGGNLAAVCALLARNEGYPRLAFQLLIYPCTAPEPETASHHKFAEGYVLTRNTITWFYKQYVRSPKEFADFRFDETRLRDFHESVVASALHALLDCDIPLVAQIDGACIGGGFEIAACCDIRVCGEASAPSVMETSMAMTRPSRSTSNANATTASGIRMTGRHAQRVSPGPSETTALTHSTAPVPIRHQARIRGRTPVPGRCAEPMG